MATQPPLLSSSEVARVRAELREQGFSVCRRLIPEESISRARKHLENEVGKHLAAAVEAGKLPSTCEGLPLEERMAVAYAELPDEAPCSWVPQMRHSFVFQQLIFRDAALSELVSALTHGRTAVVASRFNCRCKLPGAAGTSFPWHQDHAFFRMQYLLKREPPKRLLAAWAPLVRVDGANGGVELAVASHRRGYLKHRRSGKFMEVDPVACKPSGPAADGTMLPTLYPGDVMLFTDLTMHCSGLSRAQGSARWSADWAYELEDEDEICPPLESVDVRVTSAAELAPLQAPAAAESTQSCAVGDEKQKAQPLANCRTRTSITPEQALMLVGVAAAAAIAWGAARARRW